MERATGHLIAVALVAALATGCRRDSPVIGDDAILFTQQVAKPAPALAACLFTALEGANGQRIQKTDLGAVTYLDLRGDGFRYWRLIVTGENAGSRIEVLATKGFSPNPGGLSDGQIYAPIRACA